MDRGWIIVWHLLLAAFTCQVSGYDCDTGYCLPEPENFLSRIGSNSQRTIAVSSVCTNSSDYMKFPDTGDSTIFQCIANDHSAENIYDADPQFATYWQSEITVSSQGAIQEQWIEVNLTDVFAIRSVLITFTSPLVAADELSDVRPKALVIERWSDSEQIYLPWRYYAADCLASFPNVLFQPVNGPLYPPTTVVCKERYYSGDTTTREQGKPYQFVLYSPFADFRASIIREQVFQDYYSTSAIKIRLVEPSDQTELASYYSVSSLQIEGSCLCYGHADSCMGENEADCHCVHNTHGAHCEQCLPLYNQVSWQISTDISNASCLGCECNGNADSCVFNEMVGEIVCVGCYGNSYGNQCQHCLEGYYSLPLTAEEVNCTECQCVGVGVVGNSSTTCNSTSGQCQCRENVTGRTCDTCQDGFWNLTADMESSCQACDHCNLAGSAAAVCDKLSGACMCKRNVIGELCSGCKLQTFNLSADHLEGCTECDCIPGAALNPSCEHNPSGQCMCADNIQGRRCDTPSSGYFIPKIDSITLSHAHSTQIVLPATINYTVVISSPSPSTGEISAGNISTDEVAAFPCAGKENQLLTNLSTLCLVAGKVYSVSMSNSVTLTFLPVLSDREDSDEAQDCLQQVLTGQYPRSHFCTAVEYSIMAGIYGSAQECICDAEASFNPHLCDPYSGQCYCKPGITGKMCDVCKENHYNRTTDGCVDCNCNPNGSVEMMCISETGACLCHANVIGDKCDRCLPEHYGIDAGSGCKPCRCSEYAVSSECHSESGNCQCPPGVAGSTCSECQDGYYSLSKDGCDSCNCSEAGSVNSTCSQAEGTCSCKPLVEGQQCDTCVGGFHRLWHSDKLCKMCFCSGHSLQCSSQRGWHKLTVSDRWSLLDNSILLPKWAVVDGQGNEKATTAEIFHSDDNTQEVVVLTVESNSSMLYYKAEDKYLGDRRSSYYQLLQFSISYTSADAENSLPFERHIILRGQLLDYELWSHVIDTPSEQPTSHTLRITEENFFRNDTQRRSTLSDMLLLLSNVTDILIPANFDQVEGSVGKLYSVSMETGMRDMTAGGEELSNVEVCQCPVGYEGHQCEHCAIGFRRHPLGSDLSTSQCVSCDCNGQLCDLLTGECQCDNNTTGAQCDTCVAGFYGAPAQGESCMECECYSTTNNSCKMEADRLPTCVDCAPGHSGRLCEECMGGYFGNPYDTNVNGGLCQPCSCNIFSDVCNKLTGVCIGCTNHTAGDQCEHCADGFYGDIVSGCQECNCTKPGYDATCNPVTGDCQCLGGLDKLSDCLSCLPGYYNSQHSCSLLSLALNVNSSMCEECVPCDCNTNATLAGSDICNSITGQCDCIDNVVERDCSSCGTGYYGSNPLLCQGCECDSDGTKPNTTCDAVTGHCECLHSAISGRACSKCLNNTHGDFPLCSLCGDCYDGWSQVLEDHSTQLDISFSQLRDLSAPYDGFLTNEVQRIVAAIESNISLSQDLYQSAADTLETTEDVKSIFLLLHSSLDKMAQSVNILANQHMSYSTLLDNLTNTYINSTEQSILDLTNRIDNSTTANQRLSSELLLQERRWNNTVGNLTTYMQTNHMLRATVADVMQKISSSNVSLLAQENHLTSTLLVNLQNVTAQLIGGNKTLVMLQTALDNETTNLGNMEDTLSVLRNATLLLKEVAVSLYQTANSQRMDIGLLSSTAHNTKQSVQQLLGSVNIYMNEASELRSVLNSHWKKINLTESSVLDINVLLSRIEELRANITATKDVPTLQQIESLLLSIQNNELLEVKVDTYRETVQSVYTQADQYLNDTLESESKIFRNVEQVQSAARDLAGTELQINKSVNIIDQNLAPLQADIYSTLYQVNSTLISKSGLSSQTTSHLTQFKYLTNQIKECAIDSSEELSSLNFSASALEQIAMENIERVGQVQSTRSQLFSRLQQQATSVQSSQILVTQANNDQEEITQRLSTQHQELIELLEEYRNNELKLSSVEVKVAEATDRLATLIDSYKDPNIDRSGSCEP